MTHHPSRRRRERLLAVILGVLLPITSVAVWAAVQEVSESGTETCGRCGLTREVEVWGPVRIESDYRHGDKTITCKASPWEGPHAWRRAGCWYSSGRVCCYFTPVLP